MKNRGAQWQIFRLILVRFRLLSKVCEEKTDEQETGVISLHRQLLS